MTFENVLDHIPPDVQKAGNMLDRGDLAQVNHESIKDLEPSPFPFSKVNWFLQITATAPALLEMTTKNNKLFSPSHRDRMKFPCECTVHDQINPSGTTICATPCLFLLADMVVNRTIPILGPLKYVAR